MAEHPELRDVRVKICGLTRREDAVAADLAGADYLGLILSAGFGRSVPPANAAAIVTGTRARKVAVLVDESAADATSTARDLRADVVQLHGDEEPSMIEALRAEGPWEVWKSVRARSLDDVAKAVDRYGALVEGILVEGWNPGSKGGSGTRLAVDPTRVRAILPAEVELILAGGLEPDTVADAVRSFRPAVVDVSSGVERAMGVKDHERVRAFVDAARGALAGAPALGTSR